MSNNGAFHVHTEVRWHHSLIVRVVALCAVLVMCLLGSVYVLTAHYYRQLAQDMEAQAADIVEIVATGLERTAGAVNLEDIAKDVGGKKGMARTEIVWAPEGARPAPIAPRHTDEGYVYRTRIPAGGQWVDVTTTFMITPQTELVRAFKNRYLLALTGGFLLALGLMVYLIARTLRPLRELANSCAEISEGNLRNVAVRGTSGEVLALGETFNRMVESLREKEKVEANLRQAQRLSAIGNLAAGVAHDVRNPLNAIKLSSSHALDTLPDVPDTATTIKQLKAIRAEVDRLEDIVSGFLSLAREEELRREPRAVDSLLEECLHLVHKDAESRKVRLISELRCGDTTLLLDPKQMRRAILNVLINALEACPEGRRVRLFSRLTDRACEIEVRDDGPGMSREVLEQAFDPYFTTKKTGTGLGLSITRGIIEEHGGTISLSSSDGQGCQVLITFPLARPAIRERVRETEA